MVIYMEIISYPEGVIPMCIYLDLGCICSDQVYVNGVYDYARPSRVVCTSSMQVYIEYIVILILYTNIMVL
jgi:hypothetical protein